MGRSRYRIVENEYPYFMTCTVVGWLPLFTRSEAVDIVYDSWRYLQKDRDFKLFAYVILENHLHLIGRSPDLKTTMQSFKSFTARKLIELLQRRSAITLLDSLQRLKRAHKSESEHQVWQEGSHPEQMKTEEMMRQKIEYIHNNPLERGYVDDPLHWRYSSARNYARQPGLIEVVTDW
jgi:REP element-mobilizing transposase RayT